MLLWLHLLPLRPFARIHRSLVKTTNQSQEEYLTECQPLLLHTLLQLPSPAHALTASGRNGGQTTTKQPSNEKTAHPSFVNNSLHDKDK